MEADDVKYFVGLARKNPCLSRNALSLASLKTFVSLLFSLSVRKAGRVAETICLTYLPVLPKIRAAFTLVPPCPLCGAAYAMR
jgi:hypothetical protein